MKLIRSSVFLILGLVKQLRFHHFRDGITMAADGAVVLAMMIALIYALFPGMRQWMEVRWFGTTAYYYLGEVDQSGLGDRLDYVQFYSGHWDEEGAPRHVADAHDIWSAVQNIRGEIVFVDPPERDEPVPGRKSPSPTASPMTIARSGECFMVREVVCKAGGSENGQSRVIMDNGCRNIRQTLADLEAVQFGSIWIKAARVTCS